jgi:ApbE superfamily uncharacterized protein (UPF0280 family)
LEYERTYRKSMHAEDLVGFRVTLSETDLFVYAEGDLRREVEAVALRERRILRSYIKGRPDFQWSLEPVAVEADAPLLIRRMAQAAAKAGVGPMAAVAGAIAEAVGEALLPASPELIIENGGDIFLASSRPRRVGLYAGRSPFSGRLGLRIDPTLTPLGICTSSGTVGHALSFGEADAVVVLSPDAALADAVATAAGNLVKSKDHIPRAIEFAAGIEGIIGILIVCGDQLGAWGQVELVPLP